MLRFSFRRLGRFAAMLVVGWLAACSRAAAPTPTPALPTVSPAPPAAQPTAADPCRAGDPDRPTALADHEVYVTTSPDGLTFPDAGERILTRASVPDLVVGPDGRLWVYFVNGEPGHHGIYAARRTDAGTWEVLGCITLDGVFNGNAVDPDVQRLPDGRIQLVYFQGNFVSPTLGPDDPHPIFRAVSEDGLHFTVEGQIFALPGATDPTTVQLPDGSWLLAVAVQGHIRLARSEDGTAFTLLDVDLPDLGLPELAVLDDGRVVLYLTRPYVSTDGGQTWQPLDDLILPGEGRDPSLTRWPAGGGYAFAYKQVRGAGDGSPSGPGDMPAGGPGGPPQGNPFAALTPEQADCLRAAWGPDAFTAITTLQRPPTPDEAAALPACGLAPPPNPAAPGEGRPNPAAAAPSGPSQGHPQDERLDLQLTAPYLLAFHACDMASDADCDSPAGHQVYLAQSADRLHWSLVPGWQPFPGSVPEVVRRGDTLYIFTPGAVTRYRLDTGVLEATQRVEVVGLEGGFVDPSLIVDDQGRLVLFFVPGVPGQDPATCGPDEGATCWRSVRSAVEEPGSDGTRFVLVEGERVRLALDTASDLRSLSDPDIFYDGRQYVLYLSHGLSVSVWTASDLHGTYTRLDALPQGFLSRGQGGVPAGDYDPTQGRYWTFVHFAAGPDAATVLRIATHPDLTRPLGAADFAATVDAAALGLGASWMVASPSFARLAQP